MNENKEKTDYEKESEEAFDKLKDRIKERERVENEIDKSIEKYNQETSFMQFRDEVLRDKEKKSGEVKG